MKSRIPLTHANLQYFAGVPRKKLSKWLDGMLDEGTIEISLEGDDDVTYAVPGAVRSADGPATCEAYERKRELVDEAKRRILARRAGKDPDEEIAKEREAAKAETRERAPSDADGDDDGPSIAGMVGKAALVAGSTALVTLDKPLSLLDKPRAKGEKSLLASGAVSLLGPAGWLYAGSFREAVPATLAFAAGWYIIPSFLLAPFILLGALASSAIGVGYAWQYNRKKGRTPLFLSKKDKKSGKKKDE